jgi:hypothetical protein
MWPKAGEAALLLSLLQRICQMQASGTRGLSAFLMSAFVQGGATGSAGMQFFAVRRASKSTYVDGRTATLVASQKAGLDQFGMLHLVVIIGWIFAIVFSIPVIVK